MAVVSRRPPSRRLTNGDLSTSSQWLLVLLSLAAVFGGITLTDWDDANTFDRGVGSVTGTVSDCWGGKWSGCEIEFSTLEGTMSGELDNSYEVGDSVEIEYAVVEPSLVRESGYDTREDVMIGAALTGVPLVPALVLLAVMVWRRRTPDTLGGRLSTVRGGRRRR